MVDVMIRYTGFQWVCAAMSLSITCYCLAGGTVQPVFAVQPCRVSMSFCLCRFSPDFTIPKIPSGFDIMSIEGTQIITSYKFLKKRFAVVGRMLIRSNS